ncbi:uncharacterized protein LOC133827513 [Humulus lupulus]|uniref:uncharacterized protein LOC133827513 n=1 Tax=Humulus lupulus TaxID=3486 RepID=UPI002B405985|nr:uncharacterized protein LOC133827513 [Humulus lupulus]
MCSSLSKSVLEAIVVNGKLHLGSLYNLLLTCEKIDYERIIWWKLSAPKHRFILWQAVNSHLLTRDFLHYCGLNVTSILYPVCVQADESHTHLFFDCIFSKRIMQRVYGWLGEVIWPEKFEDWLVWLACRRSGWVLQIVVEALDATVYFIWLNKNICCFDNSCFTILKMHSLIWFTVKTRVLNLSSRKLSSRERQMLEFVSCV